MNNEELSKAASEMGKKGAKSLLEKRGREHMARLGRISGSVRGLRKIQKEKEIEKQNKLTRELERKNKKKGTRL